MSATETLKSNDQPSGTNEFPELAPPSELLLFYVDNLLFGIDIFQVRGVTRALPIEVEVSGPGVCIGVTTYRGRSVPIVDMRKVTHKESQYPPNQKLIAIEYSGQRVCLLVDCFGGFHNVLPEDLEETPPLLFQEGMKWLGYVTRLEGGELIGIVSVEKLMEGISTIDILEGGA